MRSNQGYLFQLNENGIDRRIDEKLRKKTHFAIEAPGIDEEYKSRWVVLR